MAEKRQSFYTNERYKKFLKNLSSYDQQKELIEIIGEAIQYGISSLSKDFEEAQKKADRITEKKIPEKFLISRDVSYCKLE